MNTTADLRVAVIVGSVRDGRFGTYVGAWVAERLAAWGVDADPIDLAGVTVPATMIDHPDVAAFAARIDAAEAIVVVTPEYNHSYPGPLKAAIDTLRDQWFAKPVAFVSYGGLAGGLRAVEALRLVFAELHAVTIRETVSLHNPWGPAADTSTAYPDAAADDALRRMTHQLLWWAEALHHARRRTPYPVA
ncbi:NADPH-dependent FMN reductase [Actinocatenispora comari]|jgi:NAD(P)H-dependent FMN reductase|uniref:FMN reductase n=1 Tax=Actinocatenispora comari TaxID=2807577 RepID=A0A8J4AH90_9ACTN|nr:NAD(P)H-dependent oxidoreductase [Actinocatenispora comari]GIL29192.1 FMN reductase [Actinocatenispora comari]GIL31853.1 FMN reductase [Actinocatenispora comari]